MTVLMRQNDRFDSPSTVFQRLSEARRRNTFQHGIAVNQPATVEHLEPFSTEGTSGQIELGRALTYARGWSAAALLEVRAQQVDLFQRDHLRELPFRRLEKGLAAAVWP